MVSVSSLSQQYSGDRLLQFHDWTVAKGERSLLLGTSGSGKTTLLHIIAGILKPSSGVVTVNGVDLYGLTSRERDIFRGRNIGIVFQRAHLIKSLTVLENVRIAQSLAGYRPDDHRAREVLDSLDIAGQQNKFPHQLSQGQQQRASIARAVVNKPPLIIADEPTSSLDDKNAAAVLDILTAQADLTGATLIVATHDQRIRSAFPNTNVLL